MEVSIIEEREELTVSLKRAHFLEPSFTSSFHEQQPQPPFHLLPPNPITKNLKVSFNGCLHPQKNWKDWVTHMHSLHQTLWKEVGIHDAILNSTYKVNVNDDLILTLAEKWCFETNSFVFPWGEVSITLEDMIFLGGYSVLGESVFNPLENREEIDVFEELEKARKEFNSSRAKKATYGPWLSKFMYSGSRVEHEAFLAYWLSRFVFPKATDTITKLVLPIAVRLARGTKIALAPAVLASLYSDLRFIKSKLSESGKRRGSSVVVWSPMQLVQIWGFERFQMLQCKPNDIENGEPRFARWCDKPNVKMDYVRMVRELASKDFCWCPYGTWPCRFYNVKDGWVLVDSGLDEELESFARCVRVSELVGVDCSCMEQYLPHRVAMQFGLGQDIPGPVARANESAEIAWTDYTRPIGDVGLYFPSRFFEPCVTSRYVNWWNHLSGEEDTAKRGSSSSTLPDPEVEKSDNFPLVPPGFPPRCPVVEVSSSSDKQVFAENVLNTASGSIKTSLSPPMQRPSSTVDEYGAYGKGTTVRSELVSEESRDDEEDVNLPKTAAEVIVPPRFSPRCPIIEVSTSSAEGQQVTAKDVMDTGSTEIIKPSMSPPMQRPSPTVAGYEAFGEGNIVRSEVVSEECKDIEEDVNLPKATAEFITPSFTRTMSGADEPLVESSASSTPNDRSFEMENVVKNKVSKELSRDISEPEKEAGGHNVVGLDREEGESTSIHELEILESGFEGRLSRLEKLLAQFKAAKAAKQGRRLD